MNIVVGGVIKRDDKYLLVEEAKKEFYGMFNLPAGRLDKDEFLLDGAKREIKEETGYDVDIKGIVQIGNARGMVKFIFLCEVVSGESDYDHEEILSTSWLTYEEILNIKDKLRSAELLITAIKRSVDGKIYPVDIIEEN